MNITQEMWITLATLIVAIILFVTEWLRVDIVALGVMASLMLTNILTTQEALAGFSNSAVITIAALFIVGGAVLQTGLAGMIGRRILKIAGTNQLHLTIVIMITVALLSGVMSDTGTVAVLLPAIIGITNSTKISPSKLLIPLSFGALLGGAMTLIGTPPNIIVSDLIRETSNEYPEYNLQPFEFFNFTPVGILLLMVGIAFMIFVGKYILPDYKLNDDIEEHDTPEELLEHYRIIEKVAYLHISDKSNLKDIQVKDSQIRRKYNLTIVEILRSPIARPVASFGDQKLILQSDVPEVIFPTSNTILRQDDVIIVQGEPNNVQKLIEECTLELQSLPENSRETLVNRNQGIAEVVLPPRSSLVGSTISETRFQKIYNLSVLEIKRQNTSNLDIRQTKLEFGDTLLVQGFWHDIMSLRKRRRDFVVLGQPETMLDALNTRNAPKAATALVIMLIILVFDILPLVTTALLAALSMVLTGCLSMDEAYETIDWKSIVLIAGMLPMATALQKVGLVDEIATQVTLQLGSSGNITVMAVLFLLTAIFTQVLSNTATAVLIAPIAVQIAIQMNIQPYAFLMTVAIAASMAFASPVASPVNTLVLGAGNYKFSDYIKVGIPMIIIAMIVTLIAVPIVFPFNQL